MPHEFVTEPPLKPLTEQGIEIFISVSHKPEEITHAHIHNALEFIYILKGGHKIYINDAAFYMEKGDLCLFKSGTIHRAYALDEDGGSYFVIKVEPSVILNLINSEYGTSYVMKLMLYNENTKSLWKRDELEGTELLKNLENLLFEHNNKSYGSDLALKIHSAKLLLDVLRYENGTSDAENTVSSTDVALTKYIYEAIVIINRGFAEDISAKECAKAVNMSYSYFSRAFKRITGKTFNDYLNRVRLNHAEKLLLSTDKSVSDICFACGFNSVSYFISQYKLIKGKTPKNYKKTLEPR